MVGKEKAMNDATLFWIFLMLFAAYLVQLSILFRLGDVVGHLEKIIKILKEKKP